MIYLVFAILFFIVEVGYFKIANRFNIIDKPNERSSHATITIRGGGIIFIVAALAVCVMHYEEFWLPVAGIVIIGLISFLDDIFTLSSRIRIIFHLAAVTLMFMYLQVFAWPVYVIIMLYILVIGIINAYNFMDGINGITGVYSLVILCGLQYVNVIQVPFVNPDMIWLPMMACLVFLFFNFRKKAKCFAGDVGSVTIAFWIVTLLLDLIFTSGNWVYLLFLAIYGVDTILTILHRLILRQNIFKAHRLHFYQILANEQKIPHLYVTVLYGLLQAVVIGLVTLRTETNWMIMFGVVLVPLVLVYGLLKPKLMHS